MNIYKLSQNINNSYDTYDSMIVVAETEQQAKLLHPDMLRFPEFKGCWDFCGWISLDQIDFIQIELVGIAITTFMTPCVICASFNAG